MGNKGFWGGVSFLIFLAVVYFGFILPREDMTQDDGDGLEEIVINEAVRTLLYLPLYHAKEQGFFQKEGLKVKIITAGSATNSFASMMSGEADFSQADPMYVPISRAKGSDALVVGQVVGRISLWVLAKNSAANFDLAGLKDRKIATHPRPMTAYTYTKDFLDGLGDNLGGVEIIQSKPGTEITPLLVGDVDFAVTLEPGASIAEAKGMTVVYSFPKSLGDRVFTALMTKQSLIDEKPSVASKAFRAYDAALKSIHSEPDLAIKTATIYFPNIDKDILHRAIYRLIDEKVFPVTAKLGEKSWNSAVSVRQSLGDIKGNAPFEKSVINGVE